ncbi:hypothetical protein BJX76DRAFT_342310 [Aspergillus varians]
MAMHGALRRSAWLGVSSVFNAAACLVFGKGFCFVFFSFAVINSASSFPSASHQIPVFLSFIHFSQSLHFS